jgi:hypothetical protein
MSLIAYLLSNISVYMMTKVRTLMFTSIQLTYFHAIISTGEDDYIKLARCHYSRVYNFVGSQVLTAVVMKNFACCPTKRSAGL